MAIERRDVTKNDLFVRPGMVVEKAKDGERIKIKNDLFVGEGMVLEKAKDGKISLTERGTEDNLQLERELDEDKSFEEGETSSCCGSFDTELGEDSENDLDDEEEDCSDDDEREDEQKSNLSLLNLLTRNLAQVRCKIVKYSSDVRHQYIDNYHLK